MKTKKNAPISLPPIAGKEVTISFDYDPITSNDDLGPFAEIGEELGVFATLAGAVRDRRDPSLATQSHFEIIRERCFMIAQSYSHATDQDALRDDDAITMSASEDPDLADLPIISRFENDATWQDIVRLSLGLIDIYCTTTYEGQPESITLDIDTTFYPACKEPAGSSKSAHRDGSGHAPLHVYDIEAGAPVAIALAPATAPSGEETLPLTKSLIRRIRRHWPKTQIILRGDSRFALAQVMDWCDGQEGVDYVFDFAEDHSEQGLEEIRGVEEEAKRACGSEPDDTGHAYCSFLHRSQSWKAPRRVVCRVLATHREFMNSTYFEVDRQFLVSSLEHSTEEEIHEKKHCIHEAASDLIDLHKKQVASSQLSCPNPLVNQMRLVLYSASYFMLFI